MIRSILQYLNPKWICAGLALTSAGLLFSQWYHDPARHFRLAMAAFSGNDRPAMEAAAEHLETDPRYEAQREFFQAASLLQDGQAEQAFELLVECQDHPDVAVQAKVLAGEAMYQLGAAGNAKILWEQALALDPNCLLAHQWLGALYFDLGAMDNAILHLQMVSNLSPNDPRPDRLMGLINYDYERPETAIPRYLETLRRGPDQPNVEQIWLELADCQIKQREFADATESLTHCPDTPQKNRLLARCEMNLGELESARTRVARSLEDDPKNVESLQLAGDLELVDGKTEKAAELLLAAAEADPYDHGVRAQLAQILARLGRENESETQSQKAEELQGIWQKFSDLQIDAINQMTNPDLRYEIGTLAEQLGKSQLALGWYKAAIAIDPRHERAGRALSQLQAATADSNP